MRDGSEEWFVSAGGGGKGRQTPPMESLLIPQKSASTGDAGSSTRPRFLSRSELGAGVAGPDSLDCPLHSCRPVDLGYPSMDNADVGYVEQMISRECDSKNQQQRTIVRAGASEGSAPTDLCTCCLLASRSPPRPRSP